MVLLKSDDTNVATRHYAFTVEYNDALATITRYNFEDMQINLGSEVHVKPFYDTDPVVIATPALASKAITVSEKITVYVKSTQLQIVS